MKKAFSDITILIDIDDTIEDLLAAWCNLSHYILTTSGRRLSRNRNADVV